MKKPVSNTYLSGLTCILLLWIPCLSAQTLTVTTPMPAPNWALLEGEVLKANTASIEEFCRVYLDERGYLLHTPRNCSLDGPDDAIETFANMTLLPALGASKNIYQLFLKGRKDTCGNTRKSPR